ncbi:MAG TPA: methyltransferase domain-containing protein [Trebonia sp.]
MTAEVRWPAADRETETSRPADAGRKRDWRRPALVWDVLREVLAARSAGTGRQELDIVDVGGGTGGFAVELAELGHRVTVVDLSPDALAAAQRRAAERQVSLTAVQGEADALDSLVGTGTADLVICHNVLEYVDSPAAAMGAIARVLAPGASVSVLAANAVAAVLQRALAGRYDQARELLTAAEAERTGETERAAETASGAGTAPNRTAGDPRRFTLAGLTALIEGAGLTVGDAHGIRVFSGLLPAADADPSSPADLRILEDAAASYPALRDIAARLHVLAKKHSLGSK